MKNITLAAVALSISGCAGTIVTYDNAKQGCTDGRCEGVQFFPLISQEQYYYQDKITDKDGKVTHFAGGEKGAACMLVRIKERTIVPKETPSRIAYEARIFETSTFDVEFGANGSLAKVGSTSTPGAKSTAEAFGVIASAAQVLKGANIAGKDSNGSQWGAIEEAFSSGIPVCNAGKIPATPQGEASTGKASAAPVAKCGHPGEEMCKM